MRRAFSPLPVVLPQRCPMTLRPCSRCRSVALVIFALVANCQTSKAGGPAVGAKVPKLEIDVMQAGGDFQKSDAAKPAAETPTVFLFVKSDKWDRPVARFMKVLDGKLRDA